MQSPLFDEIRQQVREVIAPKAAEDVVEDEQEIMEGIVISLTELLLNGFENLEKIAQACEKALED